MSIMRSVLLLALLAAAGLFLLSAPAVAQTPPPPSCPTGPGGPPPTTTPGTPAAPSDLIGLGRVFSWSDNSDDEDGFLICVSPGRPGGLLEFVVGADVTSFVLPEEAPPRCPPALPGDESADYTVYAFNEVGLSVFAYHGVVVECGPGAAATGTALAEAGPTALPDTGGATRDGGSPRLLWGVLALVAGTLIGAGALGIRRFRA